jgi:hypothetical protein
MAEQKNICSYKAVCKKCNMVSLDNRPAICKELECEHLTVCLKCGKNKHIKDEDKTLCGSCSGRGADIEFSTNAEGDTVATPVTQSDIHEPISSGNNQTEGGNSELEQTGVVIEITPPGVAPDSYSEAERKYYLEQYEQYSGYYRDPTAYFLCHQIIITEIELNWLTCYMIQTRGELTKELDSKKTRLISNLESLRKQLPEKEAFELSDDEKSMAMIHDSYMKEKEAREGLGVRRMFSDAAIALAPVLDFPMDLQYLLQSLGYDTVTALDVAQKHLDSGADLPEDPHQVALFFGYELNSEYALPLDGKAKEDGN